MFKIMGYDIGQCSFCEKDDRETIHIKAENGPVNGKFCLRCLVKMVKAHSPKVEEGVPLAQLTQ